MRNQPAFRVRWTPEMIQRAHAMAGEGKSQAKIAASFGVTVDAIRNAMHKPRPRVPSFWTPARVEEARKLYIDDGLSAKQTADHFRVSRNAIAGLSVRHAWPAKTDAAELERLQAAAFVRKEQAERKRQDKVAAKACRVPRPTRSVGKPKPPTPIVPQIVDATTARPWISRMADECAWPVGDPIHPADQLSCCAPCSGTYCDKHEKLAHQPAYGGLSNRAMGIDRKHRRTSTPTFDDYVRRAG